MVFFKLLVLLSILIIMSNSFDSYDSINVTIAYNTDSKNDFTFCRFTVSVDY